MKFEQKYENLVTLRVLVECLDPLQVDPSVDALHKLLTEHDTLMRNLDGFHTIPDKVTAMEIASKIAKIRKEISNLRVVA